MAGRSNRGRLVDQLQWGHDDGVVEWDVAGRSGEGGGGSFNGATTMVSWNGSSPSPNNDGLRLLQWGHDDGVVEWKHEGDLR